MPATEVMTEVPKIVRERLRVSNPTPADAHLDLNVLTAFTERLLPAQEREGVLAHLAACEECRGVLAVSSPSYEAVPAVAAAEPLQPAAVTPRPATRPSWFAWNRLGWAGLAAGVVIAAVVLSLHPGKQVSEQALKTATPPPATPAAPPSAATNARTDVGASTEGQPAAQPKLSEEISLADNRSPATVHALRRDATKSLLAAAPEKKEQAALDKMAPAPLVNSAPLVAKDADRFEIQKGSRPPLEQKETVEVATESVTVNGVPTQPADVAPASQDAPVMRAKAAQATAVNGALAKTVEADTKQATSQPDSTGAAAGQSVNMYETRQMSLAGRSVSGLTVLQSPKWQVQGTKLQRSVDSGTHWETALESHRNLLSVAASGNEVWAGGKKGDLFHSSDGGITWAQVHPASSGHALADDITRVDLRDADKIVLYTSKNQSWSSTDGGATWEAK